MRLILLLSALILVAGADKRNVGKSNDDVILSTRRFVLQEGEEVTIKIPKDEEGSTLKFCSLKDPANTYVKSIDEGTLDECKIVFQAEKDHTYGPWTLHSSYELNNGQYEQSQQPFFAILEDQEIEGKAMSLQRINRASTVGSSVSFSITHYETDTEQTCFLTLPDNREFNLHNLDKEISALDITIDSAIPGCNVVFNLLSHEMDGDWILVAVYDEGNDDEFHYIQPFTVQVANIEVETVVQTNHLNARGFIVDVGGDFSVTLPYQNDYSDGSCFLTNQDGVIIQLRLFGENRNTVENIQLLDGDTECAVKFIDVAPDQGGDWTLSSIFHSAPHEMQHYTQPFTIFFRGRVNTVPSLAATVQQGQNLYLRLRNPVDELTNCRVDPPSDNVTFETDTRFAQHCGIVVKDVPMAAGGMWHIFATGLRPENGIFNIEVTELEEEEEPIRHILEHRRATLYFGSSNAVYCDARDASGIVQFRGFGPCIVELERAGLQHRGTWSVSIGLPGRMNLLQTAYNVRLISQDYDVISAYVLHESATAPTSLNCRMWTTAEVRTCAFRRPDGQIFMMHDGVSSGRYSFSGDGTEEAAVGVMTSCGISINDMSQEDLGRWQCMIETSERTNTGFMTVADESGQSSNFISKSRSNPVRTESGLPVRLSCSIEAPIRYCLYRHPNGAVISPLSVPEELLYELGNDGTRLDAGICAMQIFSANVSHMGNWQCILGTTPGQGGQSDLTWSIPVHVYPSALVLRTEGQQGTRGLLMEASTHDGSAVEYCRFMRPDGLSFNEKSNVPINDYILRNSIIEMGICSLTIMSTNQVDLGVWNIAVMRVGRDREDIVRVDLRVVSGVSGMSIWIMVLAVIALTLLFLSCMGLCLHRRRPGWVRQKTVVMRNSFRRKPPPPTIIPNGA